MENNEDVNVEDTIKTPKISHSEGLKAIENNLHYFEQGASIIDFLLIRRPGEEAAKRRSSTEDYRTLSIS
ncbi:hypothetical protein TNCV_702301 [Trichonephila clavipes]|nr:hypothetical protein TNCV_702301 [Trichonephila clavipes]